MRSKATILAKESGRVASSLSVSFFSGLLLTLGDVKAIILYASLFPVFVNVATITAPDIAIISAATVVEVGGVKLGYAYLAGIVASFSASH